MTEKITAAVGEKVGGGRTFSIEYRLEFLQAWDRCIEKGSKARLLRENDLAHSTVHRWLTARAEGELTESMVRASKKSRNHMTNEARAELAKLRAENEALKKKVAEAEAAKEILGKAFGLLESVTKSPVELPEIPPALMGLEQYEQWLKRQSLR